LIITFLLLGEINTHVDGPLVYTNTFLLNYSDSK